MPDLGAEEPTDSLGHLHRRRGCHHRPGIHTQQVELHLGVVSDQTAFEPIAGLGYPDEPCHEKTNGARLDHGHGPACAMASSRTRV